MKIKSPGHKQVWTLQAQSHRDCILRCTFYTHNYQHAGLALVRINGHCIRQFPLSNQQPFDDIQISISLNKGDIVQVLVNPKISQIVKGILLDEPVLAPGHYHHVTVEPPAG